MSADDPFSAHEALDRAQVMSSMVDVYLVGHSFIRSNPEFLKAAEAAGEALGELYQLLGGAGYDSSSA